MPSSVPAPGPASRLSSALTASATLFLLLAVAWLLEARWPTTYYRLIPEDAPIEWGTFWAELLACALNALLAWRAAPRGFAAAWYKAGIALFCFLVAGEEISWGQRLFGYAPSQYFLANNIQLETNVHNLFRPSIWSAGIEIVIAAFGIVLPLLLLAERPREIAGRLGLYAPPLSWIPGFAFVLAIYVFHPFYLCEEVVELAIGVSLAMAAAHQLRDEASQPPRAFLLAACALLPLGIGFATDAATDRASTPDPDAVAQAKAELEALRQDFVAMRAARGGLFITDCNLQARLHSLDPAGVLLPPLHDGEFTRLTSGVAPKRAAYLLDPWNMPYWISDQCDSGARYIMLFSFGPNRRRESTEWAAGGDDLATYAFHLGEPRPGGWQGLSQADQITGR